MSAKTILHSVPSLKSQIIGELDDATGLAHFRGITYASVEKRWTNSRVSHSLGVSPFNAVEFGPRCVQKEGPLMVSGGANDAIPGDDEFKCLNLNITTPSEVLVDNHDGTGANSLPVMVWIHGGGWAFGANSVGRYRAAALSELAKQAGTAMVLVQINYRLGPFGFAASDDLDSEVSQALSSNGHHNGSQNGKTDSHKSGNYGLVDQMNALQWVQDHIQDFGGDATRVTAFGISAGSGSLHYHILAGNPLFDRAILMSGSAPSIGPFEYRHFQSIWEGLCKNCNIKEDTPPSERIQKLRALDPMEIIENYPSGVMSAVLDGNLLPKSWSLFDAQPPTRCKSIILGDTGVEGLVVDHMSTRVTQKRFHEVVKSLFSATDAEAFCMYFGFTSEDLPFKSYRDAMRFFFSVVLFQYPNMMIAEGYDKAGAGDAYLYHFEQPSPYPGPTLGIPYHGQCAIYMYQNENTSEVFTAEDRQVAQDLGRIWTAFASGKEPWEPYGKSGSFMRFGPSGVTKLVDVHSDGTRDYSYLGWLRDHFEETKELAQGLMRGR